VGFRLQAHNAAETFGHPPAVNLALPPALFPARISPARAGVWEGMPAALADTAALPSSQGWPDWAMMGSRSAADFPRLPQWGMIQKIARFPPKLTPTGPQHL